MKNRKIHYIGKKYNTELTLMIAKAIENEPYAVGRDKPLESLINIIRLYNSTIDYYFTMPGRKRQMQDYSITWQRLHALNAIKGLMN